MGTAKLASKITMTEVSDDADRRGKRTTDEKSTNEGRMRRYRPIPGMAIVRNAGLLRSHSMASAAIAPPSATAPAATCILLPAPLPLLDVGWFVM